jgi:DNA-binding NarL/FixJ family response regulator
VIRVVVADDQAVVRGGLRMILEAAGIEVAGEAGDGREAVSLVRELRPDVVLMDIRMPVLDGIEATRQLSREEVSSRVLVLTTYGADEYVYEALRAGAAGFMLKTESPSRLVDGIRVVADGEALLAPDITRRLISQYVAGAHPSPAPPPQLCDLTKREHQVLTLIARGMSNLEIARSLYLSEGTVKSHVGRILAKLDLRDRVQAVIFSYEHRVVQPGDSR